MRARREEDQEEEDYIFKPAKSLHFQNDAGILPSLRNRYVYTGVILVLAATLYCVVRSRTLAQRVPLPLRSPLSQLNKQRFLPYQVLDLTELEQGVLNHLGLDGYARWVIREQNSRTDQGREMSLVVTYYTGSVDEAIRVYDPSSYKLVLRRSDTVASSGQASTLPCEIDEYEAAHDRKRQVVVRAFSANGRFYGDRKDAYLAVTGSDDRYAYLSEVSVALELESEAARDAAVEAAKRLLKVAVAVLVEDHWPDWETRPIPPPSWCPWLPATSRPAGARGY